MAPKGAWLSTWRALRKRRSDFLTFPARAAKRKGMRRALLVTILLAGCGSYDDLPLLELDRIEPAEVETGETLRVHGGGFALGRSPEVVIRGRVHRPGEAPTFVDARLSGTVQSESLIEVPIRDVFVDAVGGRATLDGSIRVAFRTDDDRRDVFSEMRARIDVLPDTSALLRTHGAHADDAHARAAKSFGVELSKEELGSVGVRVASVEAGGLAARQGLEAGDVLLGLDGISLYSWRDFLPDPSTRESTVYVAREGLRGAHALRWPHEVTERPVDPLSLVLFVILGLGLGWLSPLGLAARARPVAVGASTTLVRAGLVLALAALLVWLPELQWTAAWILGLGTFASLSALVSRQRFEAVSFALAVGGALTVMMLTKTASIAAIVAAQSPSALRWYLAQSPASSLAFIAYVYALAAMSSRSGLVASLYLACAAVLGGAIFLGGWPAGGAVGAVATLAAKSAVILVLARLLEVRARTAIACSGLGVALAMMTPFVNLGGLYPSWSALVLGAGAAVVARAVLPPLRHEAAPAII